MSYIKEIIKDKTSSKTSQFILPILDESYYDLIEAGFKNAYLGDSRELEHRGQYLYLLMESDKKEKAKWLTEKALYEKTLVGSNSEEYLLVFKIPEEDYYQVVTPFMKGKYSEISREYVDKNFSPIVRIGNVAVTDITYSILKKSQALREEWEELLNTTLPEDAEVWSTPDIDNEETYNYIE